MDYTAIKSQNLLVYSTPESPRRDMTKDVKSSLNNTNKIITNKNIKNETIRLLNYIKD